MIAQHRRSPRRGTALFAGLVLALGLTTLTRAAAPPEENADVTGAGAERAYEAWVALVDAQEYARSWAEASPTFREAISEAEWEKTAADAHAALGSVRSRASASTTITSTIQGGPDGTYAFVDYKVAYDKLASAVERGTLKLDDGKWRVVGHRVWPSLEDPAVQQAINEWLALVDGKEYARSWDEAAPDFRAQVARGDWAQTVRAARGAYGALVTRNLLGGVEQAALPGGRPGRYIVAQTNASFEKKAAARETVSLQLAPDGRWRVIGYFIQ